MKLENSNLFDELPSITISISTVSENLFKFIKTFNFSNLVHANEVIIIVQGEIFDKEIYNIEETPVLDKNKKHDIDVVVDRLVIKKELRENKQRIADSVETCLNLADGILYVGFADKDEKIIFSSNFSCPVSGFTIDEIEPRLFSFNNPYGACKKCDGLGVQNLSLIHI